MRLPVVTVLLALLAGSPGLHAQEAPAKAAPEAWHDVAKGKLATASVEKALYERKDAHGFFIRVRLTNHSPREIGVELDYRKGFHPNQWGVHPRPERWLIDEERMEPAMKTKDLRDQLAGKFAAGKLRRIAPGCSLTYFIEFNGPAGRKRVDGEEGKFLIISIDGQLFFTDGAKLDDLNCNWVAERGANETDLVLPHPPCWKALPADALVVVDGGEER